MVTIKNVIEAIKQYKIIAIMWNVFIDKIIPTSQALYEGEIRFVEVTFNQAITTGKKEIAEAIATLCKYFEKNVYMSGDGYGCQSSKNSRGYRDKVYCFSQYRSAGK